MVEEPSSAGQAINEMLDAGLLASVMEQVERQGLRLTGWGGFPFGTKTRYQFALLDLSSSCANLSSTMKQTC